MQKLYQKNKLTFALLWIAVYVIGSSLADAASKALGIEKLLTFPLLLAMCGTLGAWLRKERLCAEYGLRRPGLPARRFLYYLPLVLIVSCNLWFGVRMNLPPVETFLYIGSMLCVGFLEELIFRGLLFKALLKDGVRTAIIVSSVTFGIGHIVNLVNGSGAELIPNLCQVCYAIAFGFLCVMIFLRSGSLLPCILAHSVVNALSVFSNEAASSAAADILVSVILCVVGAAYALYIAKTIPETERAS